MILSFIFFIISISFSKENANVISLEKLHRDKRIDYDFVSGSHLVFDCRFNRYICVNLESSKNCLKIKHDKKNMHGCVKFKKYNSFQECISIQRKQISRNDSKFFCNIKNH